MNNENTLKSISSGVLAQTNYLTGLKSFNAEITYTDTWYNSYEYNVGVVARVIYAENFGYEIDQDAICWIILNRMMVNAYPGSNIGEKAFSVVTELTNGVPQFQGLRSPHATRGHSNGDDTWSFWYHAVYIACTLFASSGTDDVKSCVAKPNYMTNQLFFYSASGLGDRVSDSSADSINNVPPSQVFGINSKGHIVYRAGSNWYRVYNLYAAGQTQISGDEIYADLNMLRGKFLDRTKQNVFYNTLWQSEF